MGIAIQDVDLDAVDFETVDSGGLPEAGRYHVRLIEVEEQDDGEHTPSTNLTFQILAGNPPHQQGKKITERIYHYGEDDKKTQNAVKRALAIAKRMGIYTEADLKAGKEIDYAPAMQKEFIIDLKEETYTGQRGERKSVRMDYVGIYQVGDPRVIDCPLAGKPQPKPAAGAEKTPAKSAPAGGGKTQRQPAAKAADTDTI